MGQEELTHLPETEKIKLVLEGFGIDQVKVGERGSAPRSPIENIDENAKRIWEFAGKLHSADHRSFDILGANDDKSLYFLPTLTSGNIRYTLTSYSVGRETIGFYIRIEGRHQLSPKVEWMNLDDVLSLINQ